jgi:hypothetical protein
MPEVPVGKVYMLGNSVTRHYGLFMCEFLKGEAKGNITDKITIDRHTEKGMCHGTLGVDSCIWGGCGHQRNVKFMWKNTLSKFMAANSRDICARHKTTMPCLADHFKDAQANDLLVIGSVPSSDAFTAKIPGFDPYAPFDQTAKWWMDGANDNNAAELVDMLLEIFPGYIIWHSFPCLNIAYDIQGHADLTTQKQLQTAGHKVKAAIIGRERAVFLDVYGLQSTNLDLYKDMIHHPGEFSTMIVKLMYAAWYRAINAPASTPWKAQLSATGSG